MVASIVGRCLRHRCHGVLLVLVTSYRSCYLSLLVHVALLCFIADLDGSADKIVGESYPPLEVASFD